MWGTYQCLVNMMFFEFIEKTMEVYVDDMLAKSKKVSECDGNLKEMF